MSRSLPLRILVSPPRARMFVLALAVATVASTTTLLSADGPVSADPTTAGAGERQSAFAAAAEEFGVPSEVLLGVSYLESRWEDHDGQPSTAAGFGPMHLTDAAALATEAGGHEAGEDRRGDTSRPMDEPQSEDGATDDAASLQTLDAAAELTGADEAALRADPRQNIRGGAALLARYHRELGEDASSDPADWYGAVARYSGATDVRSAERFADDVYDLIEAGQTRTLDDGQQVTLAARPGVGRDREQVDRLGLRRPAPGETECPVELGCEWIPAPYQRYGTSPGAYGNHDQADRPRDLKIDYIVIHDTEATYATTLRLVQNPRYLSWHYTLRSTDGHVAQHVRGEDVAWHAGNWYVNTHAIGLEHEGFAAQGTWYTEAMYRASARLVSYLAARYGIPLDRAHIIGHDNVPGTVPSTVRGMHWDPGPYWDWSHYFDLMGAPFVPEDGPDAGMVTIRPDFATNHPLMYGCDRSRPSAPCPKRGTTSVFLHTEPRHDAPLLTDIGLRPNGSPSTRHVSDIGSRVDTGQQFAVAGRDGDWTAVWYLGQKGWFHNPASAPTAIPARGFLVTPKKGLETVPVYGRAYPEEAAYPEGIPYQTIVPLQYVMHAGERYVMARGHIRTDYYYAKTFEGPNVVVSGEEQYYQVFLGHRVAYVKAADVQVMPSWVAPAP